MEEQLECKVLNLILAKQREVRLDSFSQFGLIEAQKRVQRLGEWVRNVFLHFSERKDESENRKYNMAMGPKKVVSSPGRC